MKIIRTTLNISQPEKSPLFCQKATCPNLILEESTHLPLLQQRQTWPSHLWSLSACWECHALRSLAHTCNTWKAFPPCDGGCGGPESPSPESPGCSTDTRKACPPNAYGSELAGRSVEREKYQEQLKGMTKSSKHYFSFQCKSQRLRTSKAW